MGIEATGKVHAIMDKQQVSERFTKQEFVVELVDNPKYPQLVMFQTTGDRCDQLNSVAVGDEVRIEFSLRGREWRSPQGEVKFFNSLDVWKVDVTKKAARPTAPSGSGGAQDDIPFRAAK